MKIYFDESGNTGCVMPNRNGDLFTDQRHFVLCGIIAHDNDDEELLTERYEKFKRKFQITGELKGSDLLKKENNHILEYFVENLIDYEHFRVCCYDKKFYLATLISLYFMEEKIRQNDPLTFYTQASYLALEDVGLFHKFCHSIRKNTDIARKNFVEYITEYDFKHIAPSQNHYAVSAKAMLAVFLDEPLPEFPLPYGSYLKRETTHMVNLTALGETLLSIKADNEQEFHHVQIIHDHIKEFEADFIDTLKDIPAVQISFVDSENELLIQYADNVASVFRKAFSQTVLTFSRKEEWEEENKWFPTLLAKLLDNLSRNNVKFVTPISDWALAYCVQDMFRDQFLKEHRINVVFNGYYLKYQANILKNIAETDYSYSL